MNYATCSWVTTQSIDELVIERECIKMFQGIGIRKTVPIEKGIDSMYMLYMFQTPDSATSNPAHPPSFLMVPTDKEPGTGFTC